MKKIFCLLLSALLLLGLSGCRFSSSGDFLEPVEFYYPRQSNHFSYGSEDGIFGSEIREASGHTDDLNYMLSMYMRGPQDPQLRSPYPSGCRIRDIRYNDDTLHLVFNEAFAELENVELSIACASLLRTCYAICDAKYVHVESVSDSKTINITLDADSFLLSGSSADAE